MDFMCSIKCFLRLASQYYFLKKENPNSSCVLLSIGNTKDTKDYFFPEKTFLSDEQCWPDSSPPAPTIGKTASFEHLKAETDIDCSFVISEFVEAKISFLSLETVGFENTEYVELNESVLPNEFSSATPSIRKQHINRRTQRRRKEKTPINGANIATSPQNESLFGDIEEAKKNQNLTVREKETRQVEYQQHTSNPSNTDLILMTEELQSVTSSVSSLQEIVPTSLMVSSPDYGMTTPSTCIDPDMEVSGGQFNACKTASESTEIYSRRHTSTSEQDSVLLLSSIGTESPQTEKPVVDQTIAELKEKYRKACVRNGVIHRQVRGLCSVRASLQREKLLLSTKLEEKTRELTKLEEKTRELEKVMISSGEKMKESERDYHETVNKIRNFHQTLIKNRSMKIDHLEFKIVQLEEENSELKFKIDELEDHHNNELEKERRRHVLETQKRDANTMQLQSRIDQLEKEKCELELAVDELETVSFELPDYYRILNLDREANDEKIRRAYRKKMLSVHPDKMNQMQPNASERVVRKAKLLCETIHRGNHILQNPRLRYQYDIWLDMSELKKTEQKEKAQEYYREKYRNK